MTRWMPWLSELQPELFAELSPELAAAKGIRNKDWITLVSARGAIEARALVTPRLRPFRLGDRVVHEVGLPFHWGYRGFVTGGIANDLAHLVLEPNVSIMETKAIMVDVVPGRRARELQPVLPTGTIGGPATPSGENVPEEARRNGGGR
jgi:formate dehydrogenase major subunit